MRSQLVNTIGEFDVNLNTVKEHLVVEHDLDDSLIELYLAAALEHVADTTRRTLLLSKHKVIIPEFTGYNTVTLTMAPIRAVTALTYRDSDNAVVTIDPSDYFIDLDSDFVYLVPNACWPCGRNMELTVLAGYGDIGTAVSSDTGTTYVQQYTDSLALPHALKLAVLMLVAHWYSHREATIALTLNKVPAGVQALIAKYRLYKV